MVNLIWPPIDGFGIHSALAVGRSTYRAATPHYQASSLASPRRHLDIIAKKFENT
jgi:hypothetical protein